MSELQEERKCRLSQYGYSMNSFAYNVGMHRNQWHSKTIITHQAREWRIITICMEGRKATTSPHRT